MGKVNLAKVLKHTKKVIIDHSPEILTGLGIAGMITSTILAVKATPKALRHIEDAEYEKQDILTLPEKVKVCWKDYIPATLTGVTSVACLIGAHSVHAKRNAALATAYKLTETAFAEYKEKVVETIGEKKDEAIREKIVDEKIKNNPVSTHEVIVTDKGKTRCYDVHSGRYFESDIETIKRAVNELNRIMLLEDYVSLNDFYDELGLNHTPLGNELGWRIDKGFIDIHYGAHICEDDQPAISLDYTVAPMYGYNKFT